MKYSYKDFLPDASAELAPVARASLQDKVAALEKEAADLKVQFADLKSDLKSLACDYDGWFRRHISDLADHAAKEFAQKRDIEILLTVLEKVELDKQIQRAVEKTFDREANELAKVIFEALVAKIQPYALKQR